MFLDIIKDFRVICNHKPTDLHILEMLGLDTVGNIFVNLCAHIGKLITCVVTGIAHRRPQGESYDQAIRNDETGLWQCPFCQQDNFPELSEVGIFSVTFQRNEIMEVLAIAH